MVTLFLLLINGDKDSKSISFILILLLVTSILCRSWANSKRCKRWSQITRDWWRISWHGSQTTQKNSPITGFQTHCRKSSKRSQISSYSEQSKNHQSESIDRFRMLKFSCSFSCSYLNDVLDHGGLGGGVGMCLGRLADVLIWIWKARICFKNFNFCKEEKWLSSRARNL